MKSAKEGDRIKTDVFGAILAFCIGFFIAAANYAFSRFMVQKHPSRYALSHIAQQIAVVVYIFALFLLGPFTPWDRIWLTAGGCVGVTVGLVLFTALLVKFNDSLQRKEDHRDG